MRVNSREYRIAKQQELKNIVDKSQRTLKNEIETIPLKVAFTLGKNSVRVTTRSSADASKPNCIPKIADREKVQGHLLGNIWYPAKVILMGFYLSALSHFGM